MENFKPTSTTENNYQSETLMHQIAELYHNYEEDATNNETFENIAKIVGRIPTLERQNSDSQDFHDISVWTLREMLRVSYELGKMEGKLN